MATEENASSDDDELIPSPIRQRLETQGYACPNEPEFAEIVPWLRFTTGLCTAWILVGTALASPVILGALVPIAAVGAVHPRHPFDYLYNHGLRRVTGTEPLPPNEAPRRFACGAAAVGLAITAGAFWLGMALVGYAVGVVLVAVGALVSTTHFCIPSTIYHLMVRSSEKTQA